MTERGRLVLGAGDGNRAIGPVWNILKAMAINRLVSQSLKLVNTVTDTGTLQAIAGLIETGSLRVIVDSTYPFEQAGEAVSLVEEGSPRAKAVISSA